MGYIASRRRRRQASGVLSPTATKLVYTTQPGTSGTSPYALSPQPIVTAQNANNITDATYVGTVTIALNVLTGSPVLSGTTTKALSSGVADFAANGLTVTGAGTWTLTASLAPLSSAVSNTGTTTSGVTTIVTDTFTRAGDFTNLGTADTGQTWANFGNGRYAITSNQANPFQALTSVDGAVINASTANATMQVTQNSTGFLACFFRWVDATNYQVWYYTSGTNLRLSKYVAGVETALGNDTVTSGTSGMTYAVTVDAANLITCKRNGTTIRTLTDATNSAGTRYGIGGGGTGDFFDNFSVTTP